MSKRLSSITGLACALWVAAWTWGLNNEQKANSSGISSLPSLQIADADSVFAAKEIFTFHLSDEKPVLPDESLILLKKLAQYLTYRPEKSLTLTGSYLGLPHERNQTQHPNLGIARATAIKEILIGEGADPDQLRTAAQEVQHLHLFEGRVLGGVEFEFGQMSSGSTNTTEANPSSESVETEPKESNEPITSGKSQPKFVFTYDAKDFTLARKNRPDLDELRALINKNPDHRIIIAGYSDKAEEKSVPGLAERRSLAIRRYLVDTGVRRRNIIVESHPGMAKDDSQRRVEISVVK